MKKYVKQYEYDNISKFRLNRLFKKGELNTIVRCIKIFPWHLPYPLSEFKKEHIDALAEYAIEEDYSLTWEILNEAPQADQQKIVRGLLDKHYDLVLSKAPSNDLMKHFELFLDELIRRKDTALILRLAEIATRMPKKVEYMARIISYVESCQTEQDLSLRLSKIPGYNEESLKKHITPLILKDIIIYISFCRDEDNLKTAIDTYFKKANLDEVTELLVEFIDRDSIFNRIYDYIMKMEDREKASCYLVKILKIKPNYHRKDITLEIVHHGSIETLSKLMSLLSEEEQEKCVQLALDSSDNNLIYDLAVTTDCVGTYKLIDTLLELDRLDLEVCLLLELKGRFIGYAWKYIFENRSIDYIRYILNNLYTLDDVGYIVAIKFIVEYKYVDLFTKQEQANIMEVYEQKEDMMLTVRK